MKWHRFQRRHRRIAGVLVAAILTTNLLVLSSTAQVPSPTANPAPSAPTSTSTSDAKTDGAAAKPSSITDTEYISVKIDANGAPVDVNVKEWYRVRNDKGASVRIVDPGVLAGVRSLGGGRPSVREDAMSMQVGVPTNEPGCRGGCGYKDIYFTGEPIPAEGGTYRTATGPHGLPIEISIRYYIGDPGSNEASQQVNARKFTEHRGPFKLVITVRNNTKRTQEVTYNDVQTKKAMTGIAEVYQPFVVRIPEIELPDSHYDSLRSNGIIGRRGRASVVSWNLNLAPPDYPGAQDAILEGRSSAPSIPSISVIAQPIYPEPVAEALSSSGQQFQKGRRSFNYDVLNLFRENLVALGGLFAVLDDSFSNLALPLIGPEKGNRDSGSFTHANLLWGMWTVAKGTEQLSRAMDDLTYSIQLARDGIKGQIATFQLLRAFLGKSTDTPVLASQAGGTPCVPFATCTPEETEGQVNTLLSESVWANLKDLEVTLGSPTSPSVPGSAGDPRPYLPEAPASLATNGALAITIIKIKLAILEHNFYCLQYEDHTNDCSTILGITNKPGATGWDKFSFVKFPFGQLEVEKGLRAIETEGTAQIQAALGNKIQPNSFVWGAKTLVEGIEALIDSFHQLGATWRYVSDSITNFGIFGVDTSKSILQLDINAIDIQTATRAAAVRRALDNDTFFGKPAGSQGQLVLSYSTDPPPPVERTGTQNVAIGFAVLSLLSVGALFARFRLFWL